MHALQAHRQAQTQAVQPEKQDMPVAAAPRQRKKQPASQSATQRTGNMPRFHQGKEARQMAHLAHERQTEAAEEAQHDRPAHLSPVLTRAQCGRGGQQNAGRLFQQCKNPVFAQRHGYLAKPTARRSRMTVTRICPG